MEHVRFHKSTKTLYQRFQNWGGGRPLGGTLLVLWGTRIVCVRDEIWGCKIKYVQSVFHDKVPSGGVGSGAVRGECVMVGGLKGCYWWKTV
jgi:hypothetical protein